MANEEAPAAGKSKYDAVAMQVDRDAGMRVQDIASKYSYPVWAVYQHTRPHVASANGGRAQQLTRTKTINWTKVQNERTEGATPTDLANKYGVSVSTIFKYTKNPRRKTLATTKRTVHWTQAPGGKERLAEIQRKRYNSGTKSRTTLRTLPVKAGEPTSVKEALIAARDAYNRASELLHEVVSHFGEAEHRLKATDTRLEEVMDVIGEE